jgi:hypothetical protein
VLVETELGKDAFQAWVVIFGHSCIVKATITRIAALQSGSILRP